MYSDADLTYYLQTSSTIQSKSKIIGEWNLNIIENMDVIGNYKNRPTVVSNVISSSASNSYVKETSFTDVNSRTWYGYTDYDVTIDGGYTEDGTTPLTFLNQNEQQKALMSLEDCFKRFRPRSGINKFRFGFNDNKLSPSNRNMYLRPRYYFASKDDIFKYWSSYRKSNDVEYGFSTGTNNIITDSAPFIKYKYSVAANRVIVKIQTNVSDIKLDNVSATDDVFYADGDDIRSTPKQWKLQKLNGTTWEDIYTTTTDVFSADGYLELAYGLKNSAIFSNDYKYNFKLLGTVVSSTLLPSLSSGEKGSAYIISDSGSGILKIWTGSAWTADEAAQYGWYLNTNTQDNTQQHAKELNKNNAPKYIDGSSNTIYKEFDYIGGLRIVVDSMSRPNTTLDLIELSPRLSVDLTDFTKSYSISKSLSDVGNTGIPVGQLAASSGNITIFDVGQYFNTNNQNSVLNIYDGQTFKYSLVSKNLQLKFYETISQVPSPYSSPTTFKDYTIPIKTMYVDGFPKQADYDRNVDLSLRDLFFYFESIIAPEMMLVNESLSVIISTLLDYIGFSNYVFKRNQISGVEEKDPVIPYFFIPPNKNVAEILSELARATQTAMFFDESNNFVLMTKGYMIPDVIGDINSVIDKRKVDVILYGNDQLTGEKANIGNIRSGNIDIYNDGKIVYNNMYIQKEVTDLDQRANLEKYMNWTYKPVLLWESTGEVQLRSRNEEINTQNDYTLSAIPLKTKLTSDLPTVVDEINPANNQTRRVLKNNTIEFDNGISYISRYNGYFYANGEIIKYDAVQYAIVSSAVELNSLKSATATSATIETKTPHNFAQYDSILITSTTPPTYNNTWYVQSATETTFTIKTTSQLANITQTGYVTKIDNVWITSVEDYQRYFSNLPIGGKMYPTGKVRIYVEPKYDVNGDLQLGEVSKHGREQFGTARATHYTSTESDPMWSTASSIKTFKMDWQYLFKPEWSQNNSSTANTTTTNIKNNSAILDKKASVSTQIANYLGFTRYDGAGKYTTASELIQSSSIIVSGASFSEQYSALSCINRISKDLTTFNTSFDTFGARLRILGDLPQIKKNEDNTISSFSQFPKGRMALWSTATASQPLQISSGGISFYTNTNNEGYYLELVALSNSSKDATVSSDDSIYTLYLYKLKIVDGILTPTILLKRFVPILTDAGTFLDKGGDISTVYDLSVQISKTSNGRFLSVYLNNNIVGSTEDQANNITAIQNVGTFVRGSSSLMFENIYAIDTADNNGNETKVSDVYAMDNSSSLKNYAVSGIVQSTFLNKLSASSPYSTTKTDGTTVSKLYYEEFGTIMREMTYLNIKFNKAYPALYSSIAQPYASKGFCISGYNPTPYGAEFLIFNVTDTLLSLSSTSANYLRILGTSFTQNAKQELTVDEYYSRRTSLSNQDSILSNTDITQYKKDYLNIKNSRMTYGIKSFSIESAYIQNYNAANDLMKWLIPKLSNPKKSIGVDVFGMPIIQLGDIIKIDYVSPDLSITQISKNSNFVVYGIEYSKDDSGLAILIYGSEVLR